MEIRTFHESDTDAVVALWKDVFAASAPHNDPAQVIRHKLAVGDELFFVALLDGQLVGTVMCGYDGHRGWIYSLAVQREFRRRGVGTALIERAELKLVRAGCPKVNLQVVASNSAVVSLYRRLGYSVEDRISMGKVLD